MGAQIHRMWSALRHTSFIAIIIVGLGIAGCSTSSSDDGAATGTTGGDGVSTGGTDQCDGADSAGDTPAGALAMDLNTSVSGCFQSFGDYDVFSVVIPSSGTLAAHTTGAMDTVGSLLDASEITVAYDDDSGDLGNFSLSSAVTAGTYFIGVGEWGGATGAYTLFVDHTPDGTGAAGTGFTVGAR